MGLEPIKPILPTQRPGERRPDTMPEKREPVERPEEEKKEERKPGPGEPGHNLDITI